MLLKSILARILRQLARVTILQYHPLVIGITGSAGKTSTREAIAAVLRKKYTVRTPEKNFNNEIGVPLTILGIPHHGRNIIKWFFGLLGACGRTHLWKSSYPQMLILEYGIDHPGDMDILLGIAKPNIGVLTAIGKIPVHVAFFETTEDVVAEKAKLIGSVPHDGAAVLNVDDPFIRLISKNKKIKVPMMTFGVHQDADVRIENFHMRMENDGGRMMPKGIAFKLSYAGNTVPFRINDAFGMPQVYAIAAAAAVGIVHGMHLVEIAESVQNYTPPVGRMRLISGINNSLILDDTYNAAPAAMDAAIQTLALIPAKRKIAILGDMRELGSFSKEAHEEIGKIIAPIANLLIVVGNEAQQIAESARAAGMTDAMVYSYGNAKSAAHALPALIAAEDLILIKGSQAIRMEYIVEALMAHPEDAVGALVRQEPYWKQKMAR
ncbi:MAG: UDP-N-acetylmuramoyl-tripeptide--D-alanyl-D-alanine ligase [Parcubacteria group bacterium Gr01-1014_66]|nr:MAG: UDP-N-acetylmuramoyl-tripeptide--D-alanyl-D-alanine ligase [Parcubacteria group bacterium Gr01-1014_66]